MSNELRKVNRAYVYKLSYMTSKRSSRKQYLQYDRLKRTCKEYI
jgi:hypothetical protein